MLYWVASNARAQGCSYQAPHLGLAASLIKKVQHIMKMRCCRLRLVPDAESRRGQMFREF